MRDVERVQAVLDRFQCGAVFALMKPKFHVLPLLAGSVTVACDTFVPDRDSDQMVRVTHQTTLWADALRDDDAIRAMLYWWLRTIWEHEFDEAIKFDGKLVRDPH